jgi:hypothetical protein
MMLYFFAVFFLFLITLVSLFVFGSLLDLSGFVLVGLCCVWFVSNA